MSTQAIIPSAAPGELAATQRVQQIQALIAQTRQAAVPGASAGEASSAPSAPPSTSAAPSGFAAALQAASAGTPGAQTGATAGGESTPYDGLITAAAQRNGIDPAVLHGLIQQESAFNPSSRSSAGAVGLTQLMPGTASSLGVANASDPAESIDGGARYLGQMLRQFGGNVSDALAAYNAGPGAVQKYGGVPPYAETQSYVTKVLGYAEAFRQAQPAATQALASAPSPTPAPVPTSTALTGATSAGSIQ